MTTLLGVTPVPTPKPKIKTITIELPIDEVFALQSVLGNVAGPPGVNSRRGLCDNILQCLQTATAGERRPSSKDCDGRITFKHR